MGQPCGVLLAAGVGRRFMPVRAGADGVADKLMQALPDGQPVALAALRTLLATLPRVVAVVRPGAHALADALRAEGAEVITWPPMPPAWRMGAHPAPGGGEAGMGASLACAVRATPNASAWVIALADMPGVRADTLRRVVHAVDSDARAIAAPVYRGQRGHPVGFGWAHAPALMSLRGDRGARDILAAQAGQLVLLEVDDPGIVADIDTPADLARFIEARA